MIISTCGFGSTGSSAVADYLLECEGTQVFDNVEFMIATDPDGLEDLEFQLMNHHSRITSSEYAIQRFHRMIMNHEREWIVNTPIEKSKIEQLTNTYLKNISQISFVGYTPAIDLNRNRLIEHYFGYSILWNRVVHRLEKRNIIKRNYDIYPLGTVQAAIRPSNFYEESRKYVKLLLENMGCDFSKHIVLDQAFSGCDPAKSFSFFENPYAIVVDRDPRDLFIFANEVLLSRGRFMPTNDVKEFVKYYRLMRDGMPYKNPNERIINISFESMIYDYDRTAKKIDDFLNLKNNNRKTIFVPEISAANTNLVKKFPKYAKEVEYIESSLEDYLFDFEKYGKVENTGKMFFGKSPLNQQ